MNLKNNFQIWKLVAAMLILQLAACQSPSAIVCADQVPAIIPPPLPQNAQQPPQTLPCLPTCLDALTVERESWQKSLTDQE